MREQYNDLYRYEGQTAVHLGRFNEEHPVPSVCHLRLLQDETQGRAVAIVTERADNPGKSVTNAAAELACKIIAEFQLDPERTTFVEHYTEESYPPSNSEEPWETYDVITFTRHGEQATHPEWRRLQPGELAALEIADSSERAVPRREE